MTNERNSPDQLAEGACVSESPDTNQCAVDAPAGLNVLKRRMSGGQSQDKQASSEKKPKLAEIPMVVDLTAHDDNNIQKATPQHPQTVQSKPLPKEDPPPPAVASRHGSGHVDSMAAAESPQNTSYGNRPQGQTQQNVQPARLLVPVVRKPTDDDLYNFLNGLANCLVTSGPKLTDDQRKIMGNYLLRPDVTARLGKRGDYLNIMFNKNLAPKLASILHAALEKVLLYLSKAGEEGKITNEDVGRWLRSEFDASRKA